MNPVRWLAVQLGRQEWLPRLARQIVGLDHLLQGSTRGRLTLLGVAGLPELMLSVVGRKSGVLRETPLLCVPHGDGWLVAGSNWGQPRPPAWVGNLLAADEAQVRFKGETHAVEPHLLTGPERAEKWALMLQTWPNYDAYAARTDREIPVFHLRRT